MKLNLYDTSGKKLTPLELKGKDFGAVNENLLAQALRIYEFNSHQKTSKVKNRSEVIGSRRKIYRQKGTGNARHGDKYAPIFVGGGIAHGPDGIRPKNLSLPKKMKKKALSSALSIKLKENALSILSLSPKLSSKTKDAAKLFSKIASHPKNKTLVLTSKRQNALYQASGNLQKITFKRASLVNARDIVRHDHIVFTEKALEEVSSRIGIQLPKPSKTKAKPKKTTKKKTSSEYETIVDPWTGKKKRVKKQKSPWPL